MGMDSDYYVAYALNDDQFEVPSKVFYYSGPDFHFVPLEDTVLQMSVENLDSLTVPIPQRGRVMEPNPSTPELEVFLHWCQDLALVMEVREDENLIACLRKAAQKPEQMWTLRRHRREPSQVSLRQGERFLSINSDGLVVLSSEESFWEIKEGMLCMALNETDFFLMPKAEGEEDLIAAESVKDMKWSFTEVAARRGRSCKTMSVEVQRRISQLTGTSPFSGSPAMLLEPPKTEEEVEEPADGKPKADLGRPLTEADRLSMVIQDIDYETSVVPQGAYCLDQSHVFVESKRFRGLGSTEALSLSSYVHYRPPASIGRRRALARADCQFVASLDPLEEDLPKGCWAVREHPTHVTLRHLGWQGYVAFHVPGTRKFGGVYFGYGQKLFELPFML